MDLLQRFQQHIATERLIRQEDELLIAVSGGVDSIVLTHLLYYSGYRIRLAHMNFGLRGEESERDENFVKEVADNLSIPFYVEKTDAKSFAKENGYAIQEAARIQRYRWFNEILNREPSLTYLCTAHHADDNIETVLMNLFRGTGIAGLKGILAKQDRIIRPLLFAHRHEIEVYAKENDIDFVEDSSNKEEKYTRNFFRLQVIPMVEKIYPAAAENMRQNIERFTGVELLYREILQKKKKKLLEDKNGEWRIPVEKLRFSSPLQTLVYEIFHPFGFSAAQTADIISLMDSETGKYLLSSTHRLLKNRNWFIISDLAIGEPDVTVIESITPSINFSQGNLAFTEKKYSPDSAISSDPGSACLDTNAIEYPLIIRPWKAGDYFYPLGMRKKKKLSRFFIDLKMSLPEKEKIQVMESAGKIIWVIGHRIDDRFKVQPHTTNMTLIKWIKP